MIMTPKEKLRHEHKRALRLVLAFAKYHKENPHLWVLFERFTKQVIASGREHYSAKAIWERIRWHTNFESTNPSELKISNNHTSYYARLFHIMYPRHEGFFHTHLTTAEKAGVDVNAIIKSIIKFS